MKALYTVVITDSTGEHIADVAWVNHDQLDQKGCLSENAPMTVFESREQAVSLLLACQRYAREHGMDWAQFIIDEV